MSRIFSLIFFVIIFFKLNYLTAIENKIIVKVNNDIITSYDLKQSILTTLILANQEVNQNIVDQSKSIALKSLINSILKKNEIKKFNLSLKETELNNQLLKISEGNLLEFKKKFKDNNLDFSLYVDKLKTELLWRKVIFNIYNNKVKINENEIQKEIINYKDKKKKEEYKISEILVSFNSEDERRNIIDKIKNEISINGFENTALKFSESTSAIDKGDLGWVNMDALTKKISGVLINMKINEVSKPILISNNVLFIKLNDKKMIKVEKNEFENLKKQIINSKKNELFNLYSTSHLSKIANNANIQYQ